MKIKCQRIISVLLTIVMLFGMFACAKKKDDEQSSSAPSATQTVKISFVTYTEESITSIVREVGAVYGELPTPTREKYAFEGWYLEGYEVKIENDTVVTNTKSHSLYARWKETNEREKPEFPQYEPDPELTKKLSIQQPKLAGGKECFLMIDEEGYLWSRGSNNYDQRGMATDSMGTYKAEKVLEDTRFVSVSASTSHVLAIDIDGGLWIWGEYGNFGEEASAYKQGQTPVQVCKDKKFIWAEAGTMSYAIDTDGTLYELPVYDSSKVLKEVMPGVKVSYVKYGGNRTFVIDQAGNLWCWGRGYSAYNATLDPDIETPTQITTGTRFVNVVSGGNCFYALDENGKLWGAGRDDGVMLWDKVDTPQALLPEKSFVGLYGKPSAFLAVDAQGKLWGWGDSDLCGLTNGLRDGLDPQRSPVQIQTSAVFDELVVTSSGYSVLGIDENGELWGWGDNRNGQIDDSMQPWFTPKQVMEGLTFQKVSCYSYSTLGIDTDGNLWEWGNCLSGENDYKSERIRQIMPGKKFKEIQAGVKVSYAIDTDGTLWAWGKTLGGHFGNGVKEFESRTPISIKKGTKFRKVVTGTGDTNVGFTYAIDESGCLWGWGYYPEHYFGDHFKYSYTPVKLFEGKKFLDVATCGEQGYAIGAGGKLWTWDVLPPRQFDIDVEFIFVYSAISAVEYYYAFDKDGGVWTRYDKDIHALGVTRFSKVIENSEIAQFSVGGAHTLMLGKNGKLWAWNSNSCGQLGDASVKNVLITDRINIMPDKRFTYICASHSSSFAIDTDGKLWAWGCNQYGELNADENIYYLTPKKIQWY